MVKGTKRKIPLEKITKKASRATCFSKRSSGLYSKASQLCLLTGAQIAVLATPSSPSNVSFYSFGHSSVDSIVSAFLSGQRPPVPSENKDMREDLGICFARKELGLGYWWEDESLYRSKNPQEIKDSMESMSILLKKLRSEKMDLVEKMTKMDVNVSHHETQRLLNHVESTSPTDCLKRNTEIIDIPDENLHEFVVNNGSEEQEQILANNNNNNDAIFKGDLDLDEFVPSFMKIDDVVKNGSEEQEQILANNNNNDAIFKGDLELDEFVPCFMKIDDVVKNGSEEQEQILANNNNNNDAIFKGDLDLDEFVPCFMKIDDVDEFAASFMEIDDVVKDGSEEQEQILANNNNNDAIFKDYVDLDEFDASFMKIDDVVSGLLESTIDPNMHFDSELFKGGSIYN